MNIYIYLAILRVTYKYYFNVNVFFCRVNRYTLFMMLLLSCYNVVTDGQIDTWKGRQTTRAPIVLFTMTEEWLKIDLKWHFSYTLKSFFTQLLEIWYETVHSRSILTRQYTAHITHHIHKTHTLALTQTHLIFKLL